ncbi:MAG: ATP-dependent phosphofructokinase / diphosphate-dependent phosphofructokinase, partial [Acidobacteriota bacterium]|nr:ATP-dependent phosphofructokinase / diphosphate-dependent phosphofructokinase [Acidobacteriota bacterium]
NGVISAVVIEAIKMGCTPIGFHGGFEWLAERYTDEQHEMTIEEVSRIHLDGGVVLGTSRTDISRDEKSLENASAALRKLGIEALVTIGGDDLVRSSAAIERATAGAIKVAQVPKSIDNDLWLPRAVSTLGFETARHVGVKLVKRLMEDAKTTGRWYLGVTMGRPTGHLTLGIGKAASATCTIIPEEFRRERVSLSDICDVVEGTIIKRRAMNRPHGVVLLAEALVERFDPAEVAELQDVDRDAQGNIRVAEIDLGRKVKSEVQARLERRGIKVTLVDKTIGYELRCAPPIPYDAEYARDLGYAAFKHLHGGGSGTMITIQGGEFHPVPFAEVIDPATGRGRQRPVDVDTESYQVARDYMVRIGEKDFRDDEWVAKLAEAAGLSTAEFVTRFNSYP